MNNREKFWKISAVQGQLSTFHGFKKVRPMMSKLSTVYHANSQVLWMKATQSEVALRTVFFWAVKQQER